MLASGDSVATSMSAFVKSSKSATSTCFALRTQRARSATQLKWKGSPQGWSCRRILHAHTHLFLQRIFAPCLLRTAPAPAPSSRKYSSELRTSGADSGCSSRRAAVTRVNLEAAVHLSLSYRMLVGISCGRFSIVKMNFHHDARLTPRTRHRGARLSACPPSRARHLRPTRLAAEPALDLLDHEPALVQRAGGLVDLEDKRGCRGKTAAKS